MSPEQVEQMREFLKQAEEVVALVRSQGHRLVLCVHGLRPEELIQAAAELGGSSVERVGASALSCGFLTARVGSVRLFAADPVEQAEPAAA